MFTRLSPTYKAILLALAAFTAFSLSDTGTKWLTQHYSIYPIVALENIFSLLALVLIAKWQGRARKLFAKPSRMDAIIHGLRGLLNFGINLTVVYLFTQVSLASLYTAAFLIPLIATVLAIPLYHEKPYLHRWISILVAFIGILIAFQPWQNPLNLSFFTMGVLIIMPVIVALMHLIAKSYDNHEPTTMAFWPIAISLIFMGPLGIIHAEPIAWLHMPLIIFSGIMVASAIALLAMAFKIGEAAPVSAMLYIQMIWGIIFGFIIFGDVPDRWMLIGAGIIILSGVYLLWREHKTANLSSADPPAVAPLV
jgi:S-adenosylmethionine uptake transporter